MLETFSQYRGLITIVLTFLALTCLNLTGNHFRIRRYLGVQIASTFLTEIYLLAGGDRADFAYRILYVVTEVSILACAMMIASRLLSLIQDKTTQALQITVPTIMAVVAFHFTPYQQSFTGVFMAVQGFVLGVLGAQTIAASALVPNRAPHRTLGMFWLFQSILFLLYACGLQISNVGWERVGEWLPAALVSTAMLKLSVDFWRENRAS